MCSELRRGHTCLTFSPASRPLSINDRANLNRLLESFEPVKDSEQARVGNLLAASAVLPRGRN